MQLAGATAPLSTATPQIAPGSYTPEQMARLAKAKEAAQKFEAAFIYQFMELSNPVTADKDNPMNGGFGEEMYKHQMNEYASAAVAKKGGFGLADHILQQMAQRGDIPPLNPQVDLKKTYRFYTPEPAPTTVTEE
ncbi:MAG TPA: rod-binding protein [Alphaproteobacteria bacterium]|nr:rod-binding protein [Alphaproteobacteria bacterium]